MILKGLGLALKLKTFAVKTCAILVVQLRKRKAWGSLKMEFVFLLMKREQKEGRGTKIKLHNKKTTLTESLGALWNFCRKEENTLIRLLAI